RVDFEILERATPQRELPYHLVVAAPLPKGDRAQFLVEKLTELGATRFVPLATARSVIHPSEAKLEKLERYVIEASKQCGRNVLLAVEPLAEWQEYCRREALPPRKVLADPAGEMVGPSATSMGTALAVGPEGGFTFEEVEA